MESNIYDIVSRKLSSVIKSYYRTCKFRLSKSMIFAKRQLVWGDTIISQFENHTQNSSTRYSESPENLEANDLRSFSLGWGVWWTFFLIVTVSFTIGKYRIFLVFATFPTSNRWISELREPISIIFGGKESPIPLLYDKSDPKEIWRFWPLWHRKNCQTCCSVGFLRFGLHIIVYFFDNSFRIFLRPLQIWNHRNHWNHFIVFKI